jgi:hypothetical protein
MTVSLPTPDGPTTAMSRPSCRDRGEAAHVDLAVCDARPRALVVEDADDRRTPRLRLFDQVSTVSRLAGSRLAVGSSSSSAG